MEEKIADVLTIEELAIYLKIPKSTLYKLVREGKIPSQKIGRHWRLWNGYWSNNEQRSIQVSRIILSGKTASRSAWRRARRRSEARAL